MSNSISAFEINGQLYNLEQIAELIKKGQWELANQVLIEQLALSSEEAKEVALQIKAINEGREYIPREQRKANTVNVHVLNSNELLEKSGKVLRYIGIAVAAIGILFSIIVAISMGQLYYDMFYETSSGAFGIAIIGMAASTALGAIVFGIGVVIEQLNTIINIRNKDDK